MIHKGKKRPLFAVDNEYSTYSEIETGQKFGLRNHIIALCANFEGYSKDIIEKYFMKVEFEKVSDKCLQTNHKFKRGLLKNINGMLELILLYHITEL